MIMYRIQVAWFYSFMWQHDGYFTQTSVTFLEKQCFKMSCLKIIWLSLSSLFTMKIVTSEYSLCVFECLLLRITSCLTIAELCHCISFLYKNKMNLLISTSGDRAFLIQCHQRVPIELVACSKQIYIYFIISLFHVIVISSSFYLFH